MRRRSFVKGSAAWVAGLALPGAAQNGAAMTIERIEPTVLFVGDGGEERQLVDIAVTNTGGEGRVTFTAIVGGRSASAEVVVPAGKSMQRIPVPPAPGPGPAPLAIRTGPGSPAFQGALPYQRRWELHIFPGSHLDIGYTHLQPDVQRRQNGYLDRAIEACEQTADYSENARFRWTIESAWVLENYLRERAPGQIERLARCVRAGQIEVSASYCNNLHDLSSGEQLVRQVYAGARRMEERFGADVVTAHQVDVSGVSWQYVQALARAGVRYLNLQPNWYRAPRPHDAPALFWWEAPDGSRVLTWYGANPAPRRQGAYSEAYGYAFAANGAIHFENSAAAINGRLKTMEERGYGRAVYAMSMMRDNAPPPGKALADFFVRWGKTYAWPRLHLSTPRRFFGAHEKHGLADLPVRRGDFTDWWADGAGSSARETALVREAQDRTVSAEILGALASTTSGATKDVERQARIDEAYRQAPLYTEHTWGSNPPQAFNDPQWEIKGGFAEEADRLSRIALRSALDELGALVRNDTNRPVLAVFNSLSWERDGVVEATLSYGRAPFRLLDGTASVPYEIISRAGNVVRLRFLARQVPPLGYKTYQVQVGEEPGAFSPDALDPSLRADKTGLENRHYRITLHPETGTITSLHDKTAGRELINATSRYQANQFLYRTNAAGRDKEKPRPTDPARESTPRRGEIRVVSGGPVSATVEITKDTDGVRGLVERITLYAGLKQVRIANTVDKEEVSLSEEAYYAFPFALRRPDITYEVPGAHVRFWADQLPGSALDWQAIGRFADLSTAQSGVTLASPSAPLVQFGRIRTQEFRTRPGRLYEPAGAAEAPKDEHLPTTGAVFSFTHNNLWFTNYRVAQRGPVTFRYALTSHDGPFDAVRETHFGADVHTPLHGVQVAAGQEGPYPLGARAWMAVDAPNVVVQTVKSAYGDQKGVTVRLLEVAGRAGDVTLTLPFAAASARLADVTERPQKQLAVRGREVTVPVAARGIVTVLAEC